MKHCNLLIVGPDKDLETINISHYSFKQCLGIQSTYELHLRTATIKMMRSDLIVTLDNWHTDEKCKKLIEIARIHEIEIVPNSTFKNYVQQKYH